MTTLAWGARPDEWAIEAQGLVKRYGRRRVLDGLDLRVPYGGVHGLLGPNGSGKTTSIRMLLGLVRGQGEMQILGHPVPSELSAVIPRVGAIVESPRFMSNVSAANNLEVLALSIGAPTRRVTEVLLEVGLIEAAGRPFRTLSLGMKQRLAIAATLLKRPDVLIFDEPTNGLDPAGIHEIRSTMRALSEMGRTVLVSSHLLSEIEQIADSVTIISQGRIVAEGWMDAFLADAAPHVFVEVEPRLHATEVLRTAGFLVEQGCDGLVVRSADGRAVDPSQVARCLGGANLWPTQLVSRKRNLEEVFLELTRGSGSAGEDAA
ncbi:ABC transporter ATP-binding protein [Tessaracoccus caeni]|uniref:ABC transporter ATP-binding protein n=1 Tax=Tessaracoccus caeni TaxID=3031239 RepID=UPI0023DC0A93|nr:ATP-binding cassette domain-containing protein [Tessaracoccus caeni]MDF1489274.1 ATP-binding cassette domain-containing protein [Tessaracoccus caeni]